MKPRKPHKDSLEYDLEHYHDDPVCGFFGCGKHLSLFERLLGKYCINHQKNNNAQDIFRGLPQPPRSENGLFQDHQSDEANEGQSGQFPADSEGSRSLPGSGLEAA